MAILKRLLHSGRAGDELVDGKGRRAPLNFRVWLLLVLGILIGGGLAIEETGRSDYLQAGLAGLVCAGCLGGMAWALDDRV